MIDRYLKPARDKDQFKGISTAKRSVLSRSSIKIRKASDEVEADTVAHCGPTTKDEFARRVNLTCCHAGWVHTRSVPNNTDGYILGALQGAVDQVPLATTGLDFDNGTEFRNNAVIKWAAEVDIYFTRLRSYKKNDQATIAPKNNHPVRKHGLYYRYDSPEERVLNRLWPLVCD